MFICTPEQMKKAEANAVSRGVSYKRLMENAGKWLAMKTAGITAVSGKQILILCGKGNNGGDGFVAARYLSDQCSVMVLLVCGKPATGIARDNFGLLDGSVTVSEGTDIFPEEYDIVIDCVFGTGFHGELTCDIQRLFERVNSSKALKIAADIPSGVDSRNGCVSKGAFRADVTLTFGAHKPGQLIPPGKSCCGRVFCAGIGISREDITGAGFVPEVMEELPENFLPPRGDLSHKGDFGRLLIIAGSRDMSGAAALNVLGALRSGAGIVRLASVRPVLDRVMSGIYECMGIELAMTSEGVISPEEGNIGKIRSAAEMSDVIAIGSGLSCCEDSRRILEETVKISREKKIPLIIDGDGLNCLAMCIDIISADKADAVLTPHPRELSRLLGISLDEVMQDRHFAACKLSRKTGAVVVAKGYPTYTVSPDGRAAASFTGNGGLSRGGSGDLLTGIMAGFTAAGARSGQDIFTAAAGAVWLFGTAADITAEELSMTGMLPSDVAGRLCSALKIIEKRKSVQGKK